jgi:2',3'-cyclic-nucleotide 2'-phosphodiesterase (5'-nucleotidase family)
MKFSKYIFIGLVTVSVACSSPRYSVSHSVSYKIPLDSTVDKIADKSYIAYIKPLQEKMNAQMNVVIGESELTMRAHKPESLLSNFSADVYKKSASEYMKFPVDVAIVNLGGLRTSVPQGTITVRKVFELMPFENELVVVWLKGDKLNTLLQGFAAIGGQGVSGLTFEIRKGKAENILIGDVPIDLNKTYTVATNDYLAAGNDKMEPLAQNIKSEFTNIKIRDMLLDYIKNETAQGRKITSALDGRIKIVTN